MRIYYQDEEIEITAEAISAEGWRYRLDDLDRIWRRGGSLASRGVAVGLGVILLAAVYRVGASFAWWSGGLSRGFRQLAAAGLWPLTLLAVVMLLMAVLGVLAFEAVLLGIEYLRRHGRYRELWARVWGEDVLLLRTSDAARFEMICRALRRALADHPEIGPGGRSDRRW